MSKKNKSARKKNKQRRAAQSKSTKQAPTVQVNVNVSSQPQVRKERVKRIQSRRRPNLREVRRGMLTQARVGGGNGASPFSNPAFYGNVKMLTDSAMNQFQNQRYGLEQQIRDSGSEQKALLAAGKVESAQLIGNTQQQLTQQLADWQKQFGFQTRLDPGGDAAAVLPVAAAAGAAGERARALQEEKDTRLAAEAAQRSAIEQAATQAEIEEGEQAAIKAGDVDAAILELGRKHFGDRDWTPGAIKTKTRSSLDGPVRKYLNFPEGTDERREAEKEARQQIGKTWRATGRDKRAPPEQVPSLQEPSVQFDLEVEGGEGSGVRSFGNVGGGTSYVSDLAQDEEKDWDVSDIQTGAAAEGELLTPETRAALDTTESSAEYYSDGGEDDSLDL